MTPGYNESALRSVERFSKRLKLKVSVENTHASLNATEPAHAESFTDTWKASLSPHCVRTLCVVMLLVHDAMESHVSECFIERVDRVCTQLVLCEGKRIGTG